MSNNTDKVRKLWILPSDVTQGWSYYAVSMNPKNMTKALKDLEIGSGEVVGLYSGSGDWEHSSVEEFVYKLLPLVDTLKKHGCIPVLAGATCYLKEKEVVANILGIPFVPTGRS